EVAEAAKKVLSAQDFRRRSRPRPVETRTIPRDDNPTYDDRSFDTSAPPYRLLYERLNKGQIIPFLGQGASLYREPNDVWYGPDSLVLPTGKELSNYLAEFSMFPTESEPGDLVK